MSIVQLKEGVDGDPTIANFSMSCFSVKFLWMGNFPRGRGFWRLFETVKVQIDVDSCCCQLHGMTTLYFRLLDGSVYKLGNIQTQRVVLSLGNIIVGTLNFPIKCRSRWLGQRAQLHGI